jgi:hypothetical protein
MNISLKCKLLSNFSFQFPSQYHPLFHLFLSFEGKYFHEPFPLFSLNLFILTPFQPLELFISNFMVFFSFFLYLFV